MGKRKTGRGFGVWRRSKRQAAPEWMKYAPGYGLLLLCLIVAMYQRSFQFNNGRGGVDWQIGTPLVTVWTAASPRTLAELRSFALRVINRDRQLNGFAPLVEDPLLSLSAQNHAEDMRVRNFYDHVTPEGRTPSDRFAAIGGQGGVGENIMFQPGSTGSPLTLTFGLVEQFQKGWMYSPGHRENLLNPQYTKVGYGITLDPLTGRIYAVQNFQ